jgi:predicted ATPase
MAGKAGLEPATTRLTAARDGLPLIETNVAVWQSAGAKMFGPLLLAYTARAYLDAGKFDAARQSIQEATTAIQTTGERWVEAEVNRVAGEIAARSLDPDTINAEAHFRRSVSAARLGRRKTRGARRVGDSRSFNC